MTHKHLTAICEVLPRWATWEALSHVGACLIGCLIIAGLVALMGVMS